ncbi:hypothetical protein ACFXPJ_06380, partial [Streptomyces goshikiensis]
MSERTGWDRRLSVAADGKGLIGHAGAVLLRRLADRTGLTSALALALPGRGGHGWRDRGAVLVQRPHPRTRAARHHTHGDARRPPPPRHEGQLGRA